VDPPCRCQHQWQWGSGHDRHFHPRRVVACALRTSDGASIGTGLGHVPGTAPVAREQPLDIPEGIHRVLLSCVNVVIDAPFRFKPCVDASFQSRSLHRMQAAWRVTRGIRSSPTPTFDLSHRWLLAVGDVRLEKRLSTSRVRHGTPARSWHSTRVPFRAPLWAPTTKPRRAARRKDVPGGRTVFPRPQTKGSARQ
jgi:hypothetical protein